jgi:hypothetical protein
METLEALIGGFAEDAGRVHHSLHTLQSHTPIGYCGLRDIEFDPARGQ